MQTHASKAGGISTYTGRKASTANVSQPPWDGSGNVATFVRCLRLLDLDQRDDWPGVHEQLFAAKASQQNLQQRVKCVEWSLYRLFEIWDPAYTKDKLRPFFPPLAPLQSFNLRAALYRGLTDLKKNGILGKETILRKTMLDECKGDKFEEVVRVFAMAVLRREAFRKFGTGSSTVTGYSEALTAPGKLTADQRERLLPLLLAHKQVLQGQLKERHIHLERFGQEELHLHNAQTRLAERRNAALAREGQLPTITPDELESISDHVRAAWTGNLQWAETLLSGGPNDVDDHLFGDTLQQPLKTAEQHPSGSTAKSLLADLNERIKKQDSRLLKWSEFRAVLEKSQATQSQEKDKLAAVQTSEPILKLDAHQKLNLRRKNDTQEAPDTGEWGSFSYSSQIVEEMRAELARLKGARFRQTSPHMKPEDQLNYLEDRRWNQAEKGTKEDARKLSHQTITHSTDVVADDSGTVRLHSALPDTLPGQGRQQDEVYSLSFVASTALHGRNSTLSSPFQPHSSPPSGLVPENECLQTSTNPTAELSNARSKEPNVPESLQMSHVKHNVDPQAPSPDASPFPSSPPLQLRLENEAPLQNLEQPQPRGNTPDTYSPADADLPFSPPKPFQPSTLLERTRQSMAALHIFPDTDQTPLPNPRTTTRQSKPQQKQKQKSRPHHHRHSTQIYPVNQFETPPPRHRQHNSIITTNHNNENNNVDPNSLSLPLPPIPASRSASNSDPGTSPSQLLLFSDQADHDSVFKSRPKLAVSPPPPPHQAAVSPSFLVGGESSELGETSLGQ